ncbi:MAG: Bax inhibitor-1/YccA family protein [Alphaproteobacteria bacterium]|nr:MAG: Bax inhibitor-1/YccA family protein [Alphaproteobacteria bacterium]
MADNLRQQFSIDGVTSAEIDQGLRSHMLKVYNYMASGVLLTGIVAMYFSQAIMNDAALAQTIFGGPLVYVVMFSPFIMVLVMNFGINKLSPFALQACYWVFAALMGVSLSSVLLMYTGSSVAKVFFITAATFGSLSLYGYTTKKSLSGMGSFLFMGLVGLIIASVVNIFLQSGMMEFVISVIGVLIFAGLTAYDTQKIKQMYFDGHGTEAMSKLSIMGALKLYLDFINMFLFLLRLFGSRN